jgi:hypothetical protein
MRRPPSVGRQLIGLLVVATFCVAAVVLAGIDLRPLPRWVAEVALVFVALELLSVGWNVARRKPWNERTLFDRIGDIVLWLPWP